MKGVVNNEIELDSTAVRILDTCVQCRACEPACPSGVPYGRMIEAATTDLATARLITPRWLRLALRGLRFHRLLLLTRPLLVLAQRIHVAPRRLGPGPLSWRNGPRVRSTSDDPDIWVFTGCVMDVWQRHTHRSLARLAAAGNYTVSTPGSGGSCCGALHTHAGMHADSIELARRTMRSMPGDAPIVVDSAGCGAALKSYGELLDDEEARRFSNRVIDAVDWLSESMGNPALEPLFANAASATSRPTVIIQDPCHHRHVQKVHASTRRVLSPLARLVELTDDGLCCGAGGAYSIVQPKLAEDIRERKVNHIRSQVTSGESVLVASANPGCSMFLARAGLDVRHPIDIAADIILAGVVSERG